MCAVGIRRVGRQEGRKVGRQEGDTKTHPHTPHTTHHTPHTTTRHNTTPHHTARTHTHIHPTPRRPSCPLTCSDPYPRCCTPYDRYTAVRCFADDSGLSISSTECGVGVGCDTIMFAKILSKSYFSRSTPNLHAGSVVNRMGRYAGRLQIDSKHN